MLDYDSTKELYLVKRVQMSTVMPEWEKEKFSRLNLSNPENCSQKRSDGVSNLRQESEPESKHSVSKLAEEMEGSHYWVPRVLLMFAAEDPRVFADRVSHAHKDRWAWSCATMCAYMIVHV